MSTDIEHLLHRESDFSTESAPTNDGPDRALSKRKTALLKQLAVVIAITTGFVTILLLSSRSLPWDDQQETIASQSLCGTSAEEASALGCSFDQLMWAWFPPQCPHYSNDDYLAAAPWRWYTDPYNKTEIEQEQWIDVLNNKLMVYGETREHHAHCVFMLFNLAQVIKQNGRTVQKHLDFEHLEHCSELLMELVFRDSWSLRPGTQAGPISYDQHC